MAERRINEDGEIISPRKRRPPATTPEARESQLIALAMDEAETQIREGRASSQLVVHFVKLASSRESKEQEKLQEEIILLRKKVETMESAVRIEELLDEGFAAFRGYTGNPDPEDDDYDD